MGRRIPTFLLKTKSVPNDGYEERFEEVSFNAMRYGGMEGSDRGFEPIFVPVLEHRFVDEGVDEVKRLLKEKGIGREEGKKYGGLIFTSQRAVELFAKLVEEGKNEDESDEWPHLQNIPVYTVGPATSRALRSIPQTPALNIFGAESGNGEALAHYILEHYGNWYKDRSLKPSLLFMVGEQRRDIIPKTLMNSELSAEKRIQVDELVVYGTGVMESFEEDFKALLKETENRDTRWVVVFSPTGCDAMLRSLGMLDSQSGRIKRADEQEDGKRKTFIATIGPTTRDYLKNTFDYEPDVCAEKPSPEGVIEGIKKFLDNRLL